MSTRQRTTARRSPPFSPGVVPGSGRRGEQAACPGNSALTPVRVRPVAVGPQFAGRLLPLLSIIVLLLLWALVTSESVAVNAAVRSFSPFKALPALGELLLQGRTWTHVLSSLRRVVVGLGLATVVGLPLGVLIGSLPWLERATSGPIQFMRMISPLSWMPIAVMLLGIGDIPVYFLLAIAAVWPVLLNTAQGVKQVEPTWVEEAITQGATAIEMFWYVIGPAIFSHVVNGFRLGLGITWIVLVPAEMLGVRAGLGYAILDARDRLAYPELIAVIILIGLIGWTMDTVVRQAERSRFNV